MTRLGCVLPLLPLLLVACSSSDPQHGTDSGAPRKDGATTTDGSSPPADSSIDAGADAALDPFVPHPPSGSTQCGSGVISAGSAQVTCNAPSMVLDDVPQIDGGTASTPRSCSALTIGDGEWQVWCSQGSAYVWARIPFTNANVLQDCHGASLLMIDYGVYESGNGGGSGLQVMTYETNGTEIAGTPPNDPQVIVASMTIPTSPTEKSGAMSGWILGSLEDTCNQGAMAPPTVLTGFDATWKE